MASFFVVLLLTRCNKNVITENPALPGEKHGVSVASLSKGLSLLPAGHLLLPSLPPCSPSSPSCLNLPPARHPPPRPSRPHTGCRGEEVFHRGVQHRLVCLHLLTRQAPWLHFLGTKLQAKTKHGKLWKCLFSTDLVRLRRIIGTKNHLYGWQ